MANKVNLTIAGGNYSLVSDESVAYMNELGPELDSRMREMLKSPRVSTTMAAILCALNCMDEAKKAESAADNLRAQMKSYLDDNARARMEADNARREVDRLRRELEAARRY